MGGVGSGAPLGNDNAVGNSGGRPPLGNSNSVKHGASSSFSLGKWPPGTRYFAKLLYEQRRKFEAAIREKTGDVTAGQKARVQSALRHEGRCMLLQRYLASETGLTLTERMGLLRDISEATEARDRCLEKLGLNAMNAATGERDIQAELAAILAGHAEAAQRGVGSDAAAGDAVPAQGDNGAPCVESRSQEGSHEAS